MNAPSKSLAQPLPQALVIAAKILASKVMREHDQSRAAPCPTQGPAHLKTKD
jgi:hypothetical protein